MGMAGVRVGAGEGDVEFVLRWEMEMETETETETVRILKGVFKIHQLRPLRKEPPPYQASPPLRAPSLRTPPTAAPTPLHQPGKKRRQRLILRLPLPLRRRCPVLRTTHSRSFLRCARPLRGRRGLLQPPDHVVGVDLDAAHVELYGADLLVDAALGRVAGEGEGVFCGGCPGGAGGGGVGLGLRCQSFVFFGFEAVEDGELGCKEVLGAEGGDFEGLGRGTGAGGVGFGVWDCFFVDGEDGTFMCGFSIAA